MDNAGTLYIVATPIGNLEDMTQRAIRVLAEVSLIAAEDTRHSQKLMQHYDIPTRLISLHDHNENQRAQRLIERLQTGEDIALISDAGTPLISDPGFGLVNQCRDASINVVPVPGPCAAITALSAAGLPTDRFRFEGFLPVKQQARLSLLETLLNETAVSVFYESPRRVVNTLDDIRSVLGETRNVVIARELTKTFETFFSGPVTEALAWIQSDPNQQKGEFVLLVAGTPKTPAEVPEEALGLLHALLEKLSVKDAAAVVAKHYGLKKNTLYQLGLKYRA